MLIGALLRQDDREFARAFAVAVRDRGHAIEVARSGEELLVGAPYDLVIADAQLPGQWSGLGLIEALSMAGETPPAILVSGGLDAAAFHHVLRLGVRDLVPRPLDGCALMESVEKAFRDAALAREGFIRTLAAIRASVDAGSRALGAFLLERGVPPSHRLRATTALAEVLHLACREADGTDAHNRVALRARSEGDSLTVEVETQGALVTIVPPALPGFPATEDVLGRARRLCETLDVYPTPSGSRVVLSFELAPVHFQEEGLELADLDYLHPEATLGLLPELARAEGSFVLPPSLTTTLLRLLGDRTAGERAFAASQR